MKAQHKPRADFQNRRLLQDVIPLSTPYVVVADPASACNFSCRFCPNGDQAKISDSRRFQGVMPWRVFTKIIDDLHEFDHPIKVLRLYKDGEPFLNKKLPDMIAYAKKSGRVGKVDTTTNGSLLTPERMAAVLEAGLDQIAISIYGLNREQYKTFSGVDCDFDTLATNIKWLYANKGNCEVIIKSVVDLLTEPQQREFFDLFGNHCDRITLENFAELWPEFDVAGHTGSKIEHGMYDVRTPAVEVCPYIFYMAVISADGQASVCVPDWNRKLVVGDVRTQSLKDIWNSDALNALRRQHLEGRSKENPICAACGVLACSMIDRIDPDREKALANFMAQVGDVSVSPPGMPRAEVREPA